uniref:HDC09513 n=1 Tax=Drosophila melanogaster TaxID=7227 RepID=Q6ILE9_DROME|nr:TPA_inf: HDC09513 [Drosophila melanogaster]
MQTETMDSRQQTPDARRPTPDSTLQTPNLQLQAEDSKLQTRSPQEAIAMGRDDQHAGFSQGGTAIGWLFRLDTIFRSGSGSGSALHSIFPHSKAPQTINTVIIIIISRLQHTFLRNMLQLLLLLLLLLLVSGGNTWRGVCLSLVARRCSLAAHCPLAIASGEGSGPKSVRCLLLLLLLLHAVAAAIDAAAAAAACAAPSTSHESRRAATLEIEAICLLLSRILRVIKKGARTPWHTDYYYTHIPLYYHGQWAPFWP